MFVRACVLACVCVPVCVPVCGVCGCVYSMDVVPVGLWMYVCNLIVCVYCR